MKMEQENFRKYAWPVSSEVAYFMGIMRSEPQHSCSPNTEYAGLNVIAGLKPITETKSLTLWITLPLNNG